MQAVKATFKDLSDALTARRLWFYMANSDIRLRYRGSTLGPVWITITMIVFISALSIVYSRLFNQSINEYVPFLSSGILIWNYLSSIITDSSDTFLSSKEFIEGMKVPYFLFIFRMIWRNFIVFMHNFVVYLLVMVFFHVPFNEHTLLAIPGFILVTLILAAMSVIISLLGTRYRDLPPIISALMMVLFFVTPINWQARLIGEQSRIIQFNVLTYWLDLIRTPLLGGLPKIASVYMGCLSLVVLWCVALWAFSCNSKKIPFWL